MALFARAALAICLLVAAACGVIGGDALTDAQQAVVDMQIGPSDLSIVGGIAGDIQVGESSELSVQVSQPAYAAVLRVMPNGATTLIFPNRLQPSAKLPANQLVRIPDPGSSLPIAPDQPGVVLFEFIASTDGGSWLFNRKPEGSADFAELGTTTRALTKLIVASLKVGHGPATAAAHLTVRVRRP